MSEWRIKFTQAHIGTHLAMSLWVDLWEAVDTPPHLWTKATEEIGEKYKLVKGISNTVRPFILVHYSLKILNLIYALFIKFVFEFMLKTLNDAMDGIAQPITEFFSREASASI